MRATRYPSSRRPNGKAVNLLPSVLFPTVCIFDKYTPPPHTLKGITCRKQPNGQRLALQKPAGLLEERLTWKVKETERVQDAALQHFSFCVIEFLAVCTNHNLFNLLSALVRSWSLQTLLCSSSLVSRRERWVVYDVSYVIHVIFNRGVRSPDNMINVC